MGVSIPEVFCDLVSRIQRTRMANLECHLSLFLADFLMKVYRQVCLYCLL